MKDRLAAAIEAAPYVASGELVPHIDSQGKNVPTISERPDETRDFGDYDKFVVNVGYAEPANGVLVTRDEYPHLFNAYATLLYRSSGIYPHNIDRGRDPIIYHERRHGNVFEALGASTVLYAFW